MKALILAGGKGTRLRPLTVHTPKPVVPVMNKPFLHFQLELLRRAGINDVTLSIGYQPDKIEHLLGDGSGNGVLLKYVTESVPLGTGGAYKFAAPVSEPTIVLNGDVLTDLDIAKAVEFHRSQSADATIVLARVTEPWSYGIVETDDAHRVMRFIEKPKGDERHGIEVDTINAGIYILEQSILDLVPSGVNRSFEYDIFPELLKSGRKVSAYILDSQYWRDIGTPASYLAAHHDFLSGKISGFAIESPRAWTGEGRADDVSLIDADCVIKTGASLSKSVIGAGVHVDERATVRDSVVWPHTRIAAGSVVDGAIIGRGCHVGRNVAIAPGTVLGDKSAVTDYSAT
jgi:NDP-sugar pyrophosphorylase family protein